MRVKLDENENVIIDQVKNSFDKVNDGSWTKRIKFFVYEVECVEVGVEDEICTLFLRFQKPND